MLTVEQQATNAETLVHIRRVQQLLNGCIGNLLQRGERHDASKLASPEVEVFAEFTPKLKNSTYGSDEYKSFLLQMKPALDHHYANNEHHPEYAFAKEEWRPVKGYEGLYDVSTIGRVKRLARIAPRETTGDMRVSEKMLALPKTPKGYLRVSLMNGGVAKNHLVHRLVALSFLDNVDDKPEVNHIDGCKFNNVVTNLEWATAAENQQHAYDTGLKESNAKYFVHCVDLDIVTRGCVKMETALRERGFATATAAGVYGAMDNDQKHLAMTFVGYPISDGMPQNMLFGMNILSMIEMLCDWRAASERHADGSIMKSIEINAERFSISPEVVSLMKNTVVELGWA